MIFVNISMQKLHILHNMNISSFTLLWFQSKFHC